MEQVIRLEHKHSLPIKIFSPILGLSPLELELLLEQSLENVKDFHNENPDWKEENPPRFRGNYFWQEDFLGRRKSVKGKIPKERYLETPQVFVEIGEKGYSTKYNSQIDKRITEKLAQFRRVNENRIASIDNLFSKQFAKYRNWIVEQQVAIVKYLCNTQKKYLQTGNPFDLESINQQKVAEHIEYSATLVSKLVKNLTTQLPDGRVIFVNELIPGANLTTRKGTYALRQLQKNPKLYERGRWKVYDKELASILEKRYGIKVARRTVSRYKSLLK